MTSTTILDGQSHCAGAPSPRLRGEGRGEGAFPRAMASAVFRGGSAPLTPTLSPQERGEGARALCLGYWRNLLAACLH
jgi:hypothetical protein